MPGINISMDGVVDADDDEPPEKSGKKKLIIIVATVLLLLGGAGGGWFMFFAGGEEEAVVEDLPPVIEVPPELTYVNVDPIFIQVETKKGVLQNVVVTLALEVERDSDGQEEVKQEMPRLFEAYLKVLTSRPLPGAAEGNVDATHVKNRVRAETLRLLGPGKVYDVVLRGIWVMEG